MIILIISLAILAVIAAVYGIFTHKDHAVPVVSESSCTTCDGASPTCEQVCMMEAAVKDIQYFDDEELDAFIGRDSDSYESDEIEQFADVLFTLPPNEVKQWGRSLIMRGIFMPDELKDEYIMLAEDEAEA